MLRFPFISAFAAISDIDGAWRRSSVDLKRGKTCTTEKAPELLRCPAAALQKCEVKAPPFATIAKLLRPAELRGCILRCTEKTCRDKR
jgi:hypothetical protein